MKKLLIITDTFLPRWDGVSRFLDNLIPLLSKQFEVTVIAPKYKGIPPEYEHAKIVFIPIHSFSIGDYAPPKRKILTLKKEVDACDIIFTQTIGLLGSYGISYGKKKSNLHVCNNQMVVTS